MASVDSSQPLVSIVTPSLNSVKYIAATVESVLSQDYPRLEYIVMDGGSTDATVELLRQYGDRITVVSEPDGGTADAVNRGFARSRGSVLAWLSADDLYVPGAVTAGVEALLSNPGADVVYGKGRWIDSSGASLKAYPTGPFDAARLSQECFICQPASFFTRESFERAGGLDTTDQFTFDYDLWIRLSRFARFHYVERELALSRMHLQNKSLGNRKQVLAAGIALLRRHYGYVPMPWVNTYASHLVAGRDQFYEAARPSLRSFALTFALGLGVNRRHPLRWTKDWLGMLTAKGKR